MTWPIITARIAFETNPLVSSPTWVDVSAYVRADPSSGGKPITIRRGRQYELNRIEAGTMQITLDNRDRRFDPTYTASPYYPYVVPMRKINIRAFWSPFIYDVFTGFIENWPPDWPGGQEATITIDCVDAFKMWSIGERLFFEAEKLSGDAILGVLNVPFGWPSGAYSVDAGSTTIAAINTTMLPLQRINDICEAEQGVFFIDGAGNAIFRGRHSRLTATTAVTSQATFGDGGGAELPYLELQPSFDDALIFNSIRVTPAGGSEQSADDSTSKDAYLTRTLRKNGLVIGGTVSAANNEAASMAAYLLASYKDPHLRFTRISVTGAMDGAIWPQLLFRDIGDRITVIKRPPGGGASIQQDCFIEGVGHIISYNEWVTSWELSPASSLAYWILDSTTNSVLDSTTRLAY